MEKLPLNNNQKPELLSLKHRPFSSVGLLSTLSSQNHNENISNRNSNSTIVNHTDIYKRKLIGKSKKKILVTIKEEATINKKTDQLQPEDKFCKICFDTNESNSQGKLISPCRCQGSVQYIHDECLKTWLVSQRKDIQNASCEICHTKYKMTFKYGSKFYPRQALEDGLLSLVSSICLLLLVITLIVIIIVFALRW